MALEMRPDCEACGTDLPAEAPGAFICSFECTFCAECAEDFDDRCPNCGGELLDRVAQHVDRLAEAEGEAGKVGHGRLRICVDAAEA
jgi:hypothetical protein